MKIRTNKNETGFSIAELMIAMVIMLVLMGIASTLFSKALGVRSRESRKTGALTSAEAALNIMSREIANSGFGLYTDPVSKSPDNGIILADSDAGRIHIRSNITNTVDYSNLPNVGATSDPGEDVTYFFDSATKSIVRYDPNAVSPSPRTSAIVNKISNVTFDYFNYAAGASTATQTTTPTTTTGRVRITVTVQLDHVDGQPDNQTVTFTSDVTLRNSASMLQQY
jgi:prepilin-type N-terminal cleavage/methylation domain-containing protein